MVPIARLRLVPRWLRTKSAQALQHLSVRFLEVCNVLSVFSEVFLGSCGNSFRNIDNGFTLKAGQMAVIDFGQNASGWVSYTVKGARGTRLRFRFGEMINTSGDRSRGDDGPAGSIYTENLRSAEATLYYTLRGDEEGSCATSQSVSAAPCSLSRCGY